MNDSRYCRSILAAISSVSANETQTISRRLFFSVCNSMAAHESRSRSPLTSHLPGRVVCSEEMLLVSASPSLPRLAAATKRTDLTRLMLANKNSLC